MSEEDDQDVDLLNDAEEGAEDTQGQDTETPEANSDEGEQAEDSGDADEGAEADEPKDSLTKEEAIKANKRLFHRLKEAQGFKFDKATGKYVKREGKPQEPSNQQQTGGISGFDTIAFVSAGVTEKADIQKVLDYAKYKKIDVSEALKSSVVKAMLKEEKEYRNTANATSTGPTRRGSISSTGKELHSRFEKTGELPQSEDEMDKMLDARYTPQKS